MQQDPLSYTEALDFCLRFSHFDFRNFGNFRIDKDKWDLTKQYITIGYYMPNTRLVPKGQ